MRNPGRRLRRRRLASASGVACVLAVLVATAVSSAAGASSKFTVVADGVTADSTFTAAKSPSSAVARTDPSLLGLTSSDPVDVMIKYDFDATASYAGGVAGLAATSPSVTGVSLPDNTAAVTAYDGYADARVGILNTQLRAAVPGIQIGTSYLTVYGGVAASVAGNQISTLLAVPGVVAVQRDSLAQQQDDFTSFVGATTVWQSLGGSRTAGSNVTVGVIDTGLWPEHPMLSPTGVSAPAGGLKGCQFGDGSDVAHLGPTFACNNKLIGAYAKTATYMANVGAGSAEFCNNTTHACSPRDSEGHGTHTTTTAAGDCVTSAMLYGVERGPVCGIAPGAHVIMYRVCLAAGCFSSDSVSAVQQAIADGVNVINFSVSGGADPYTDPVELAFLDAFNAGITVSASAGNSGPGAATSDHGGPWTMTVGATTGPREFRSTLHLTADGGATYDKAGITLTNGVSAPAPVVLAQSLPGEDVLCQTPLAPGTATGKIVACQRGTNARVDKGYNVLQGGAVGMILYNASKQDVESDNHWLPAIHLDGPNTDLLAFISSHTNVMASFAQGTPQAGQADMMAAFSSRGPRGDWIKPDISAPGVQVLAGMTPQPTGITNGPAGNLYQAIAGTSMSAPHAAGVAALVKAAHPTWTPAEIKSAIMTSSVQAVVKEDGTTPATPFDMGSGRVQVDRAVNPTLVFNETYANMVAAGADKIHRIDLNLASIDATTMSGSITTNRTAINVSGRNQNLAVEISEPAGVDIVVGKKNKNLHVEKDGTLTFPIAISAPTVATGQYFGSITLEPQNGGNNVYIPVAFVKQQGIVTMATACAPTSIAVKTGVAHCSATLQNLGSVTANASLDVEQLEKGTALRYKNVGLPGSVIGAGDGVQWSGPLTPALAPQVGSITANTGPAGGYLPLSVFGVTPIAGVGDDTITNFNVPTYYYGGEAYNRIGVVSNGYVVIGGGDTSDVNFFPQTFPNAARPNNVVAPFWTDLNPAAAGGGTIRIGTLTDGSTTWVVIDFNRVKNFSNATTHSGEIWARLAAGAAGTGPASEEWTVVYGTGADAGNAAAGDPGSAINWGAENRDGSSGKNVASAPADGSGWRPVLSGPTAGGQVTIPWDITSKKDGMWNSIATMTSDQTAGSTQIVTPITVTP
jgi:subtilisin family serine protease